MPEPFSATPLGLSMPEFAGVDGYNELTCQLLTGADRPLRVLIYESYVTCCRPLPEVLNSMDRREGAENQALAVSVSNSSDT